jgi:hypothetical protein
VAAIQDAYKLLPKTLGVTGASILFALALLASGQNSTLTGTLAGQIVMEGFINIRLRPWLRRLITRDARDHSRRLRHRIFRRKQDDPVARRQPGRSFNAAGVCHLASDALHRRKGQDGRIRNPPLDQNSRLDDRCDYHCPQRETAFDTFMPASVLKIFYGHLGWPVPTQ